MAMTVEHTCFVYDLNLRIFVIQISVETAILSTHLLTFGQFTKVELCTTNFVLRSECHHRSTSNSRYRRPIVH